MKKKAQTFHKHIFIGITVMGIVILAVVYLFISLSMQKLKQQAVDEAPSYREQYRIEFAHGFAGRQAIVYLNDSLLWDGLVLSDTTSLTIRRFADSPMLMVHTPADDITSSFNLSNEDTRLILRKEKEEITMQVVKQQ